MDPDAQFSSSTRKSCGLWLRQVLRSPRRICPWQLDTTRYASRTQWPSKLSTNMHDVPWPVGRRDSWSRPPETDAAGCVRVFTVGMDPQDLLPVRSVHECHVARHFVVDAGRSWSLIEACGPCLSLYCQIGTLLLLASVVYSSCVLHLHPAY